MDDYTKDTSSTSSTGGMGATDTGTTGTTGSRSEEFRLAGDKVVTKVKELVAEGNVRRIILKNEEGHTLFEVPMTAGVAVGVAAAWLFPVWAAIGAVAALVAHLTLVVERVDEPKL